MPDAVSPSGPDPFDIAGLERNIANAMNRALSECGMIAQREAVKNAPRSPKASEIRAVRKARWESNGKKPSRKQKDAWKGRRNPRATTRPKPGGLERSIKMAVSAHKTRWEQSAAEIYVSADAEASKYAVRIHDEKFKTWRNRGVGTVEKGARADEKFIQRAIDDNERAFREKFSLALDRALGG